MKKFLLTLMIFVVMLSIIGNSTANAAEIIVDSNIAIESNAVLQFYAYGAGGANYVNMSAFDSTGALMSHRQLEPGYVYDIPVQLGGHVEFEVLPADDFVLSSSSISSDTMIEDDTHTHFDVSIIEAHGYVSFIFKQSPSRVAVFDIRSFKGYGTITFSGDGAEKSKGFDEGHFYKGYVPTYEELQKMKTPAPVLRAAIQPDYLYRQPMYLSSMITYYQSLNKVYVTGKYTATIKVNGDAYVEVDGVGTIIPKNGTESFELNKDIQVYQIRVQFLGDPPHPAL